MAENGRIAAEKSLAVIQSVFQTTMGKVMPHKNYIEVDTALKGAENRPGGTRMYMYSKVSVSWGAVNGVILG